MILTANAILNEMRNGRIRIDPFIPENLGPNSYDLRLSPELKVITDPELSLDKPYETHPIAIPEDGFVLRPGDLYLGASMERTESPFHVPHVDGRSTLGRYFMQVHMTAGRGDLGFAGTWTWEITVQRPLRIFPRMRVGQVSFYEVMGTVNDYKRRGHYLDQVGPREAVPNNF